MGRSIRGATRETMPTHAVGSSEQQICEGNEPRPLANKFAPTVITLGFRIWVPNHGVLEFVFHSHGMVRVFKKVAARGVVSKINHS